MEKGISPLIAAVLLIAFTMAVAGLAGPFLTEVMQDAQRGTDEDLDTVTSASNVRLEVMEASFDEGTGDYDVTIRNTGTNSAENFTVTVLGDDPVQKQVNEELGSGDVYSFTVSSSHSNKSGSLNVEMRDKPVKTSFDLSKAETVNTLIDDYEDNDLSEYEGGDSSGFKISSTKSIQGDYFVQYNGGGPNYHTYADENLSQFPERGEKFSVLMRNENTANGKMRFFFGIEDDVSTIAYNDAPDNGYGIGMQARGGDIVKIWKRDDGTWDTKDTAEVDWSQYESEWLEFVVDWRTTGLINVSVYQIDNSTFEQTSHIASTWTTDSEYNSGGIGIGTNPAPSTNPGLKWDYWRAKKN